MVELKVLAVVGLILTAVVTSVTVVGAVALARWTRRVIHRRLAPQIRAVAPSGGNGVSSRDEAQRLVRGRQAAGRLRC
ncbi:MAG: hypothetical protein ACREJ9_12190 [Candidatus Rokuibacteriota bacterium]